MKYNDEIKEVTINEWIWIIFAILSLSNVIGDELELSTLYQEKKHNPNAKQIFLTTASIALLIYLYFTLNSYNKLKKAKLENKNTNLQEVNLIGNSFVFIGAIILLYTNIKNKNETTTDLI